MRSQSLFYILGFSTAFILTLGISVRAQSLEIDSPVIEKVHPDKRVVDLMASTSLDIGSASIVVSDKDSSKAIIKELRDTNILLRKILNKL